MKEELEMIDKITNSKIVEKVYDDAISTPMIEVSKIGVDLIKSARLILSPLQLAATLQDRFEIFLKNLNKRVPTDEQVQPPAELTSVCLEKMKYIDLNNPLWGMFEELLINATDKKNISKVHPSFGQIIGQLSPDEAVIIYELTKGDLDFTAQSDLNNLNKFENQRYLKYPAPEDKLVNPEAFKIYSAHLESLSIITWHIINQEPEYTGGKQTGIIIDSKIMLTDFGRLFAAACIPETGFTNLH